MSKLQILIPQYNEGDSKIKPLLDSIAIQQDIDFNDIEVFIGNDGSDTKLSVDFLKQYKYRIQYHYFEHGRLAATRQKLFELVTAPYVMWCDADDCFISTIALSTILLTIDQGFDSLVCDFVEQNTLPNGKRIYIPHSNDPVFVHGKVYNVKFLHDNHINWHPELHEHQDSPFNVLALNCAKNKKICKMPLYMWCQNKESTCRKNGIYHLPNTWPHMLDSYQALINDLKDRGMGEYSCYYAKYALYATYYEMSHQVWKRDDIPDQKLATYIRIREFFEKNELLIRRCTEEQTKQIIEITEKLAKRKGPLTDMPPFEEWLEAILKIF